MTLFLNFMNLCMVSIVRLHAPKSEVYSLAMLIGVSNIFRAPCHILLMSINVYIIKVVCIVNMFYNIACF